MSVLTAPLQGWAPSPWFLISAPDPAAHAIRRSQVIRRIARTVRDHRVTCVAAPPGYGKTVAVGQWAARAGMPCAWLTLTRLDVRPARLYRGVVSALQEMADLSGDDRLRPLLGLNPDLTDLASSYDALVHALDQIRVPIALVIDDAHLSGDGMADSIVAALAEHGSPGLRMVLVGSSRPALPERVWLSESVGWIGADVLAFAVEEVVTAAAAVGQALTTKAAAEIHAATEGWPAAVRLTLIGREGTDGLEPASAPVVGTPALLDYVAGEILRRLPPELAEFVLATTTCSRVNATLAAVLSDRDDSAALLDECVSRGLFLDRFAGTGNEPVYRWHALFADHCREILRRDDPDKADRLNRTAARALADVYPLEGIVHAERADDYELAVRIVLENWIGLVLRAQAASLEAMCSRWPAPWSTDPAILLVRACCLDIGGDRLGGAMLAKRVTALGQPSDERRAAELELTRAAASLMLVDDHTALMAAVDTLASVLESSGSVHPRTYGPLLFLLGWAELRLRRDTRRAVALLETARRECEATDDHLVAHRAAANLSFALAYGGRFNAAAELLTQLTDPITGADGWQSYDGGIESMAAGMVAYYRDELADAETHLLKAIEGGGGEAPYAALARIYLTFVACDLGDPHRQLDAERGLRWVSDTEQHGVPWGTYKMLARCRLAAAGGQTAEVVRLAEQLVGRPFVPVTTAMVAESLRQADRIEQAAEMLVPALAAPTGIAFVDASVLLTQALIEWSRGNTNQAHRLLEQSLDIADEESVARPYGTSDPVLRELLVAHAAWGTHHEGFLAARIAQTEATVSRKVVLGSALSRREHEVLGFLRTSMTTADIAKALYVSINTIKTHQRAIYRKLGVTNRRDAVKVRI